MWYSMLASLAFGSIKQTGDSIEDYANVLQLIQDMENLATHFPAFCTYMRALFKTPEQLEEWTRTTTWEYVLQRLSLLQRAITSRGGQLDTILEQCRRETSSAHPKVNLNDLNFVPPAMPKPQGGPTLVEQAMMEDDQSNNFYGGQHTRPTADIRDDDGLYEAIGCLKGSSCKTIFIAFKARYLRLMHDLAGGRATLQQERDVAKLVLAGEILTNPK